jgi:hypothetical protein
MAPKDKKMAHPHKDTPPCGGYNELKYEAL